MESHDIMGCESQFLCEKHLITPVIYLPLTEIMVRDWSLYGERGGGGGGVQNGKIAGPNLFVPHLKTR